MCALAEQHRFAGTSRSDWTRWRRLLIEVAKPFPKCNAQNAFFIGIKELSVALVEISWLKAKPANIFTNGDWTLSQSRTTSSRRSDLEVLRTAKLRHRKTIPIAHPLMRSKDIRNIRKSHTEQVRQKCTDETPIRLPRSTDKYAPSPP